MPRLLACHGCRTLIKLRDFTGTNPNEDSELVEACNRHQHNNLPEAERRGALFVCDQATYDALDVETSIQEAEATIGGRIFNETRDEFKDDALACWRKHGSPTIDDGCADFRTDAKVLGNGKKMAPADRVYLCSGCPLGMEWATDDQLHAGAKRGHRGVVVPVLMKGRHGQRFMR